MKINTTTLILGGLAAYYLYCSLKPTGHNNACLGQSPTWYPAGKTPMCNPLIDLGVIKCDNQEEPYIPPQPYGGPTSQSSCPDGTIFEIGIGRNFCTPITDTPIGANCMSSFGPGHIEWNDECKKCPDEVKLGCGMPGPGKMCTNEMKRGTPFVRKCIDNGFTTARSRPV